MFTNYRVYLSILLAGILLSSQILSAQHKKRCGADRYRVSFAGKVASDCGSNQTVIRPEYSPDEILTIRVVVHNLHATDGTGKLSEDLIKQQIKILNEDFGATPGTVGAAGTDSGIRFVLATQDPSGNPTNGINYVENDAWFRGELEDYGPSLHWDPKRYMNFYIASSEEYGGVVYQLPWEPNPVPGWEGMVVVYQAIGPSDFYDGPNHTATHEAGHYLGLEHTFNNLEGNSCPSGDCYTTGDYICDTKPHTLAEDPTCSERMPCGESEPIHNYMNYTSDRCMNEFTPEQINRMRCSIMNYRQGILTNSQPEPETLAKRWIPHVTSQNGGFETEIYLTNTAQTNQSVVLKSYDAKGMSLGQQTYSLNAGERLVLNQDQAFAMTNPSHAGITGAKEVLVSFGYRVAGKRGVTAHLAESSATGTSFLLHFGEQDLIFDGLAMLNLGKEAVKLSAQHIEPNGNLGAQVTIAEDLAVGGKALADISRYFTNVTSGMIRITATQPVMVLGLRGSKPGAEIPYLFYNPVIALDP